RAYNRGRGDGVPHEPPPGLMTPTVPATAVGGRPLKTPPPGGVSFSPAGGRFVRRRIGVAVKLAWLAPGGAAGTLARYGLGVLVPRWWGSSFPWGTLVVNALGCFLFGLVWALAERRLALGDEARVIVLTGFVGAFTTFSTFAFETGQLLRGQQGLYAGANVAAQLVLGLGCLSLGAAVGGWAR